MYMPETSGLPNAQQYNEHGHPRNPETRRRERENVRAANEVMQVTGVVEDSIAARAKAEEFVQRKNNDTFLGLRLMEAGRAALVGGVWGVLGLRRRILVCHTSLCMIVLISNSYTSHTRRLVFSRSCDMRLRLDQCPVSSSLVFRRSWPIMFPTGLVLSFNPLLMESGMKRMITRPRSYG